MANSVFSGCSLNFKVAPADEAVRNVLVVAVVYDALLNV